MGVINLFICLLNHFLVYLATNENVRIFWPTSSISRKWVVGVPRDVYNLYLLSVCEVWIMNTWNQLYGRKFLLLLLVSVFLALTGRCFPVRD